MNEQSEESESISKILSGDSEAFRYIVRQYEKPLLRYVLSIVKDESIAADVVQETFIKTYTHLHAYNRQKKFSSWLYRIAHNEALNSIKRWRREISLEEWDHDIPDQAHPMDLYERKADREHLLLCLKTIKPIYAGILVLFFLEEKTYEEISEIMQIPIGTVGTRITRGKLQLHHICQNNTTIAQ